MSFCLMTVMSSCALQWRILFNSDMNALMSFFFICEWIGLIHSFSQPASLKIICPPPLWCLELSSLFPHTCLNAASVLTLCYSIIPWSNVLLLRGIFIFFMRFRGISLFTHVIEDSCSRYLACFLTAGYLQSSSINNTTFLFGKVGFETGLVHFHWGIFTLM